MALSGRAGASEALPPKAVQGRIDVSGWDFARGALRLDGEWELYFGQLLEPADFERAASPPAASPAASGPPAAPGGSAPELTGYVKVPGSWRDLTAPGPDIPRHGVATYRLVVTGVPLRAGAAPEPTPQSSSSKARHRSPPGRWMLEIPYARTAYRLWVNGELVAANGVVSADLREIRPQYRPILAPVDPAADPRFTPSPNIPTAETTVQAPAGTLEIVMQVANAHFRLGGLPRSIVLGPVDSVVRNRQQRVLLQMLFIGGIGLMAIVFAMMYAGRRSERSLLYFALLSGDVALRAFFTGDLPFASFMPGFPWELQLRIEYFTGYFGTWIFILYLDSLCPGELPRWMKRLFTAIGAAGSVVALVLPVRITSFFVPYHIEAVFLLIPPSAYVLVQAVRKKREGSLILLAGGLIFLLAVFLTLLHYNHMWMPFEVVPYGLFALLLSQAIVLSQRYACAFRQASELAAQNGILLEETRRRLLERDRLYRLLIEQDEKTRRAIAETLHGSAQARLFEAARTAEQAAMLAERDPKEAAKLMRSVSQLVEHVRENDIREASHRLVPAAIAAGLVGAVEALCRRLPDDLSVDLRVDPRLAEIDDPGGPRLKESLRIGLYRIVEEALNNIQRHAKASRVTLSLGILPSVEGESEQCSVELVITDDGVGFDPDAAHHGLGLRLIAARAIDLGGDWQITSAPGQGTTLRVVVPLQLAG